VVASPPEVFSIQTLSLEIRWRSDATVLPPDSDCILMHVLSESLVWGLGFTQAIDARWPAVGAEIGQRKLNGEKRAATR